MMISRCSRPSARNSPSQARSDSELGITGQREQGVVATTQDSFGFIR